MADRDLERRVVNYLVERRLPSVPQLAIEASGGIVTLRGRVHSISEKQLAVDCCQRVAGVIKLIDTLDVPMTSPVIASRKARTGSR